MKIMPICLVKNRKENINYVRTYYEVLVLVLIPPSGVSQRPSPYVLAGTSLTRTHIGPLML